MKPRDSSTQASFDAVSVLCGLLALVAAAALTMHLTIVAKALSSDDLRLSWMVAMGVTILGVASAFSSSEALKQLGAGLPIGIGIAVVLTLVTHSAFAIGIIVLALVGWAMAVPLTEWACGTAVSTDRDPESAHSGRRHSFRLTSARSGSNPIPSALIVGMLLFTLPAPLQDAAPLAALYLCSVILLASLGNLREGARKLPGRVELDDREFKGWFPIAALMLLACLLAGVFVPLQFARLQGMNGDGKPQKGLISFKTVQGNPDSPQFADGGKVQSNRTAGQQKSHSETAPPKPNPGTSGPPKSGKPKAAPPPPPPPPDPAKDLQERLIKLLILAAVAAALLWLVKRYGSQIFAALKAAAAFVARPFVAFAARRRERKLAQARDRAIQEILARQPDPFAPITDDPVAEDLPAVYDRLLAYAGLHDLEPRVGETTPSFFRRLETVYALDRADLALVDRACSLAEFSARPPNQAQVKSARAAADRLCEKLQSYVPSGQVDARQAKYRRRLAERILVDTTASETAVPF